jgi:hypothetical protein
MPGAVSYLESFTLKSSLDNVNYTNVTFSRDLIGNSETNKGRVRIYFIQPL